MTERISRRQMLALAGVGPLGLVAGTLYPERFCARMDLRSGAGVQMAVSAVAVATVAGATAHFAGKR